MSQGPPHAGSLAVEDRGRKDVEQVVPRFILSFHLFVDELRLLSQVLLTLYLVCLDQALDSVKKLETLCPWDSSLIDLVTPVFGTALHEWVFWFLINQTN